MGLSCAGIWYHSKNEISQEASAIEELAENDLDLISIILSCLTRL